jgi:hypothetical protein
MKERSRTASALISTSRPEVMKWITREKTKVDRVACMSTHQLSLFPPHDKDVSFNSILKKWFNEP